MLKSCSTFLVGNGSRLENYVDIAQSIDDDTLFNYDENDYGPSIRRVIKNMKENIEYAAYYNMSTIEGNLRDRGTRQIVNLDGSTWDIYYAPKSYSTIAEDIIYSYEQNPFDYLNTEIVFQEEKPQDIHGEDIILIWPRKATIGLLGRLNTYLETHPMHGYGGREQKRKKWKWQIC